MQLTAEMKELKELIFEMDRDQLNMISNACKMRRAELDNRKKSELYVGGRVKFKGKYGEIVEGTVAKINPKTIHISVPDKYRGTITWRVSPGFIITE
jgi:ribosomal protein L35AE/L33A